MEGIAGLAVQRGLKRGNVAEQDTSTSEHTTQSGSVTTSQSGMASPSISKRPRASNAQQQGAACIGVHQFPVLEYHMQQCQQMQGTLWNNTLQPADSSTWSNWQQLQQELLNQADAEIADSSQPQLARSNSAPELVKLTQADSGSWQQAHAASTGGANQPTAAVLSHKDFWLT